jgi:hypothetical protein
MCHFHFKLDSLYKSHTQHSKQIKNIPNSLKLKHSCDEEMLNAVLKSCTDYTIDPLSYICDQVIAVVFPE